jgi:hypothetical protein
MYEQQDIRNGLRKLRTERRQLIGVLIAYLPLAVLCSLLLPDHVVAFAGAWMLLFLAVGVRNSRASCPRCAEFFHRRARGFLRSGNVWSGTCQACGLSIGDVKLDDS